MVSQVHHALFLGSQRTRIQSSKACKESSASPTACKTGENTHLSMCPNIWHRFPRGSALNSIQQVLPASESVLVCGPLNALHPHEVQFFCTFSEMPSPCKSHILSGNVFLDSSKANQTNTNELGCCGPLCKKLIVLWVQQTP